MKKKFKELLLFLITQDNKSNCKEKKIDSVQKVPWYWKIVGSKLKNNNIKRQIFWGIFF